MMAVESGGGSGHGTTGSVVVIGKEKKYASGGEATKEIAGLPPSGSFPISF